MAFGCMIVNVNFIKLYVSWTWRWGKDLMDLGGQRATHMASPEALQLTDSNPWTQATGEPPTVMKFGTPNFKTH